MTFQSHFAIPRSGPPGSGTCDAYKPPRMTLCPKRNAYRSVTLHTSSPIWVGCRLMSCARTCHDGWRYSMMPNRHAHHGSQPDRAARVAGFRTRRVLMSNGFAIPPDISPLPPFEIIRHTDPEDVTIEKRVFATVNRCLQQVDQPTLPVWVHFIRGPMK